MDGWAGLVDRCEHGALIVDSDLTIEKVLVPLLLDHISAKMPVLMVVGEHTERSIRDRLRESADALEWGDVNAFYQRLGFAYEGFRRYLAAQREQGRSVHVIAEPDVPTDLAAPVDRVAAYLCYEALCNEAFAGYGCPVTCVWDSRRHPAVVIEDVRSIHQYEITDEGRRDKPEFISASAYLSARSDVAMAPAPATVDIDLALVGLADLDRCRDAVDEWAAENSFAGLARKQVVSAAHEVLVNGLKHGVPPVRLRCWTHGRTLVIHVDDHGNRSIPVDAGYRPPGHPSHRMGMWVARQFADVLITRTNSRGTAVRMYFPFVVTHRQMGGHAT